MNKTPCKNGYKSGFLTVFVVVFLSSCNQLSVESSSPKVTYQSNKEVVEETVSLFPTTVSVPMTESIAVRERLQFFFKGELKASFKESNGSFSSATPNFVYKISYSSPDEQGHVAYTVSCQSRVPQNQSKAIFNAKNIARFIRDGILERSLGEF